jgi:hypothetical protein
LSTDVRFEAEFLRAALLVGLVRETDVHAWAESLLEAGGEDDGRLTDVLLAPAELTAIREALRPISEPETPRAVGTALLAFMANDPSAAGLSVSDQLRVLSLLRREGMVSADAADSIKLFEDRLMLASVNVAGETAPTPAEMRAWLADASAAN